MTAEFRRHVRWARNDVPRWTEHSREGSAAAGLKPGEEAPVLTSPDCGLLRAQNWEVRAKTLEFRQGVLTRKLDCMCADCLQTPSGPQLGRIWIVD